MPPLVIPAPHRSSVAGVVDGTVRLAGATVLRGVEMHLDVGEVVAVTGANGSGKSTLLRVLAGLLPVAAGQVTVPRVAVDDRSPITLVAHEPALHRDLTVRENLDIVAQLLGRDPRAVGRSLERVGLSGAAPRLLRACSQGMVRRAELARVLLSDPVLLLLDEAHAALDPNARDLVAEIARSVADRGGAALVVTHDVMEARTWADRVLTVRDGRTYEDRP